MPIADSTISKLGLTREQLMEAVEQRATARNGRAIRTALTTLRYADARAESGGESVARAVMIETGFAPDWLQYELTDPFDSAKPIRTDFAWERQARELTLGELDGLIKYTDQTMLAGRTTAEALVAERQREAHLSLYGHPLLRFTMSEVRSAGLLAKKLQTAGIRQTALPAWLNEVELQELLSLCPSACQTGTHFPVEAPTGKCVPLWSRIPGCAFRQRLYRKAHPILSAYSGTQLPLQAKGPGSRWSWGQKRSICSWC